MNTQMTVIEQNRQALQTQLIQNKDLLQGMPLDKQSEFRENFIELASNTYLTDSIKPRELVRFAIDVTKMGLNVNPIFKEVYIIPFNTKINKTTSVMLPQAIIPQNGIKQMAYDAGFFLKIDTIFNVSGEIVSESEMTKQQQIGIDTTSPQWVEENFLGFNIVLEDLNEDLPLQEKFIEAKYVKEVTKTLKDQRFKIQSWKHKAVRRAWNDFFIPRGRKVDILEKIEALNETATIDVDIAENAPQAKNNEKISPMSINKEEVILEGTIIQDEEKIVTPNMVIEIYKSSPPEMQAKIVPLMSEGWREFSQEKLKSLYEMIKGL